MKYANVFRIRLTDKQLGALEQYATEDNVRACDVIRTIIDNYIEEREAPRKVGADNE